MHVYTFLALYYLPSYPLCPIPPPPTGANPPALGRTCSAPLFSDFAEEKTEKYEKKNMTFLFV
jgi:hypothetical protein